LSGKRSVFGAKKRPINQDAQLALRANLGLGLHCHYKHDIVEHLNLNFAPPQAEASGNLKLLGMPAALVKARFAEIVVLCLDFDRRAGRPADGMLVEAPEKG
jgi:hypothetical protein